jgi:hypothetical protein
MIEVVVRRGQEVHRCAQLNRETGEMRGRDNKRVRRHNSRKMCAQNAVSIIIGVIVPQMNKPAENVSALDITRATAEAGNHDETGFFTDCQS